MAIVVLCYRGRWYLRLRMPPHLNGGGGDGIGKIGHASDSDFVVFVYICRWLCNFQFARVDKICALCFCLYASRG